MTACSCAASSASAISFAVGNASPMGSPTRDPLGQVLALDEFHDEGAHTAGLFHPVDMNTCRQRQRRTLQI
jgi:hypothetical protein